MMSQKDRLEAAIRHIQTASDVDPWAVEIAVEAMEKKMSKKPIDREGYPDGDRDTASGCCPECGIRQIVITPRYYAHHKWYCRDCGQAIDWGTSDE